MKKRSSAKQKRKNVADDGEEEGEAFAKKITKQKQKAPVDEGPKNVIAQFVSADGGVKTGAPLDLPLTFTENELQEVLNELLSNEDPLPYSFFVKDEEVVHDLKTFLQTRSISTGIFSFFLFFLLLLSF
jgi:hypothetical protein